MILTITPPGLGVILALVMAVFVAGLLTMLLRRHALIALAGAALMLQACILALAAFAALLAPEEVALSRSATRIHVLAIVVIAGMAAQLVLGLAISWSTSRHSGSARLDDRILEEVDRAG